jgi:phosphoglycolate phosphatase-like HAD superfamily hydrolase
VGYDVLVFDLDGTLIDSAPDIVASLQTVQRRLGREVLPADRIVAAVGSGVRLLISRNAGVDCVAVTYGYSKPGEIDSADHRIDRFGQLLELLR